MEDALGKPEDPGSFAAQGNANNEEDRDGKKRRQGHLSPWLACQVSPSVSLQISEHLRRVPGRAPPGLPFAEPGDVSLQRLLRQVPRQVNPTEVSLFEPPQLPRRSCGRAIIPGNASGHCEQNDPYPDGQSPPASMTCMEDFTGRRCAQRIDCRDYRALWWSNKRSMLDAKG
jgi:hypothetical protein